MDNLTKEQVIYLFESYNGALEEIYEEALKDVEDESVLASQEFQIDLQNRILNGVQPWFSMTLEGLVSGTPEAFFDQIVTLEDALEIFDIAAKMVDGDLPELFLLRLGAFGDAVPEALLKRAFSVSWEKPEDMDEMAFHDSLLVSMAALRILGFWKNEESVTAVLDAFLRIDAPNEFLSDGIRDFVVGFEGKMVPELLFRLENASDIKLGGGYEYLLIFLAQIGVVEPSEEIFQALKSAFRNMGNKVIAVLCLGDYGDGRAVPMIKSYLDRNIREMDRQFFYESQSVIKKLGGDISDIKDPFKSGGIR